MSSRGWVGRAIGCVLMVLAGCSTGPRAVDRAAAVAPEEVPAPVEVQRLAEETVEPEDAGGPPELCLELGQSVEGRPIEAYILGNGPEVTLVMATIHGNEPAGTPLCFYLLDHLRHHPQLLDGRQVIIVPVANPDGFAMALRGNTQGVDLNRNFPAPNRTKRPAHGEAPLSEPEALLIHNLILEWQPTRIISFHQPLACIDYDGPIESLAHRLAELSGLPVKKLGSRPGSLGSFASMELNVGVVTFELPRREHEKPAHELWARYGEAVIESITFREGVEVTAGTP